MTNVVDAIISQLEVRLDNYRKGYVEAIDLNRQLDKAEADLDAHGKARAQSAGSTATSRRKAAQDGAQAEEQADQRVTRSRKKRTDDEIAQAERSRIAERDRVAAVKQGVRDEANAVKQAEKEKQTAIAETARAREASARTPTIIVPPSSTRTQAEADAALARHEAAIAPSRDAAPYVGARAAATAAAPAVADREINAALLERVELQERLKVAEAGEADAIRQRITEINLATAYERAGLDVKEAALRLDRELAVIEGQRAARAGERSAAGAASADLFDLRARASAAPKEEAQSYRDQIDLIQRRNTYVRAGYDDQEIAARIERETLAIEADRLRVAGEQAAVLERQMRAQQGAIANKISGTGLLVGGLVGGLGAEEISHLNDKYIELSNSLKVAGVSTQELQIVQEHLLATANRNGTDINALADVFRSASLGAHDLGLNQADLLKITDAASNSLRIQGVSSERAQGALLQLGHAFESGRVQAREFNSLALNLYPLLQAAARGSDQFGGSVAKLRAEIVAGNVSSKIFAQSILNGAETLRGPASRATLTTAQGFTSLRNALIVYFGEADKAQGISAALGATLQRLADNLDTLIPAIAAVATALTVGYISRLTAAAIATRGFGASVLGAFGGPVGLAITTVGLAIEATVVSVNDARQAASQAKAEYAALKGQLETTSTAAHAAAGGIAGVGTDALGAIPHVNAFAGAVGNLAQQLYNQARAARAARVEQLQGQLQASQQKEKDLAGKLPAGVAGAAREYRRGDLIGNVGTFARGVFNRLTNTLSGGYQDQDNREAYRVQAEDSRLIQQQIAQAKTAPITAADVPGGVASGTVDPKAEKALASLNDKLSGLEKLVGSATGKRLDRIKAQIDVTKKKIADIEQGVSPAAANAAEGGGGGARGPSAETLRKRAEAARIKGVNNEEAYNTELKREQTDYLEAQADLTNDAAKRAELERDRVRFAADQNAKEIAAQGPAKDGGTGKYTAAEVTTLQKLNTDTADTRIGLIDQAERIRVADEARAGDEATLDAQKARLQAEEGLATTLMKRRSLAEQILDIEYKEKEKALEAVLAFDSKASPADKEKALVELQNLPAQKALDREGIDRQDEGVGKSYLRGLTGDRQQLIEGSEVKVLQDFNSELDDSVKKALHLHGIFGDIISDLVDMAIKQALIKPLAGSLFGNAPGSAAGGASGLLGKVLGFLGGGGGGLSEPALNIGGGAASSLATNGFDFASLLTAIPGLAGGGSFEIGGKPGIDKNLLSINGRGVARVNNGETVAVLPPNVAASNARVQPTQGGDTHVYEISVNAENSVTPAGFARGLAGQILQEVDKRVARSSTATLKATPGAVRRHTTLGE